MASACPVGAVHRTGVRDQNINYSADKDIGVRLGMLSGKWLRNDAGQDKIEKAEPFPTLPFLICLIIIRLFLTFTLSWVGLFTAI